MSFVGLVLFLVWMRLGRIADALEKLAWDDAEDEAA